MWGLRSVDQLNGGFGGLPELAEMFLSLSGPVNRRDITMWLQFCGAVAEGSVWFHIQPCQLKTAVLYPSSSRKLEHLKASGLQEIPAGLSASRGTQRTEMTEVPSGALSHQKRELPIVRIPFVV